MYRYILDKLKIWKEKTDKMPLIIRGARQVGKTWVMLEFAKTYKSYLYVNFDEDKNELLSNIFSQSINPKDIIAKLEIYYNTKINDDTLLIFDEIQECPRALSSLKYFSEFSNNINIICAGSLLGIAMHKGTNFPVGKVEFLDLFPLSFEEFLLAKGEKNLVNLIQKEDFDTINTFNIKYVELLKEYFVVGGMPQAVNSFCKTGSYDEVRQIQNNIISSYENDFGKYAEPNEAVKIRQVFEMTSKQLAKENKKFVYSAIKESARSKEYETAIQWLIDAGIIYKVNNLDDVKKPLKSYSDDKTFKIYLLDVGILGALSGLSFKTLLNGDQLFVEFKGSLTENYVLTELKQRNNLQINYWTNKNTQNEVDFIIEDVDQIYAIEVKSGENLRSRSLKFFKEKYNSVKAIKTSILPFKKQDNLTDIPLYLIGNIKLQ